MTKTRSVTLGCSLQSESGISHPMTSATYCPHRRARNGHCQQRGASGMGHAGGGFFIENFSALSSLSST